MLVNEKNWNNLLNYYIAVMQRETDEKITFTLKGKGNKYYTPFQKEKLFSTTQGKTIIPLGRNSTLRRKIEELKIKHNTGHWYYGYPLFRQAKKSRYNDGHYSLISPILYSEIKVTVNDTNLIIELLESRQNINPMIFNAAEIPLPKIEDFDTYLSDLNEREERKGDVRKSMAEIIKSIEKITGIPCMTEININNLSHVIPSNNDKRNLILNNALIFYSDLNSYKSSVIRELDELKKTFYFNKMKETSLYPILTRKLINKKKDRIPTLLIAESNNSQFSALKEALSNKVTVVSGPPGTGKSQVVLNLISSLISTGKTGILVSKTNAAVDIICDYYHNKFEIPIILRTGNKENRIRAIELIDNMAKETFKENITNNDIGRLQQIYLKLFEEIFERDLSLHTKYELADQMVNLTEEYQLLRNKLPDKILGWVEKNKIKPEECNKKLDLCSELINNANDLISLKDRSFFRWLWGKIKNRFKGRHRGALIFKVNEFINEAGLPIDFLHEDSNPEAIKIRLILIKDSLSINFSQSKLIELKAKVENLPGEKEIIEKFEKNEKETIEAGRKYLQAVQSKKYSTLTQADINKLRDFVKAQNELNGEGRTSKERYKELKWIESNSFPFIEELFPVWATTSPSAKNSMFPLGDNIFDLLIIDEASQCDFASMIPLLYRAKNVCVIGDINQLPNIVTIDGNIDKSIANNNNLDNEDRFYFGYRNNSIYDIAERALQTKAGIVKLDEHYRSHPDIINFSNKEFYGRFLKIYTNPKTLAVDPETTAVEWIDVKGEVKIPNIGSAYNKAEVEKIFELTLELMKKYSENIEYGFVSIGIVTPLRAQVEYITWYFARKVKELSEEEKSIYLSYTKGPIPFYIDTAYKFQGNERDVLIFSTVASEGMKKGTYNFINERRQLNVAITRARAKLYIVGNKEYCKNNKGLLGSLAKYADELIIKSTKSEDYENRIQSPLELKFYKKLKSEGFEPIPQYSDEGFNIDFAIIKNDKRMAIEVNGVSFHKSTDGKTRKDDIIRKRRLMNAGWEVKIFWSWDIMQNLGKCVEEITEFFKD